MENSDEPAVVPFGRLVVHLDAGGEVAVGTRTQEMAVGTSAPSNTTIVCAALCRCLDAFMPCG
jgi:hypothetical protein